MKPPYLQEPQLQIRVNKFVDENPKGDEDEALEHLINNYKEYQRKSKKAFCFSVKKAFDWAVYQKGLHSDSEDSIDIVENIEGDSDIDFIKTISQVPSLNSKSPKYKKKSFPSMNNSTVSSPYKNKNDINGFGTPPQESLKKRRRMTESAAITDSIKRKKKKEIEAQTYEMSFDDLPPMSMRFNNDAFEICKTLATGCEKTTEDLFHSVLVTGCTGSGKTTFIRSIAGTTGCNVISISASELVGDGDLSLGDLLGQASSQSPCILHIDHLEKISEKDVSKTPEKKFLSQLDITIKDLEKNYKYSSFVIMVETRKPETLDYDIRSKFDLEIFMPIPDEAARIHILHMLGKDSCDLNTEEWEYLGKATLSYVVGDLLNLLKKAKRLKRFGKFKELSKDHNNATKSLSQMVNEYKNKNSGDDNIKPVEIDADKLNLEDFKEALKHIVPSLKNEMFPTIPEIAMSDVGSLEDVKGSLTKLIINPIMQRELHETFNANRSTGILMWGPPGCGKTLLAQAIANVACLNLLPVSGPELLSMYQGESERAIRETFQKAKTVSPCIIFFDEFDAICPARNSKMESGSKTTVVNTLLAVMNGITKRDDVYVIAATNRPDMIDPAVTRPGRFDTTLYVGLPDLNGKISILNAITKNKTSPKLTEEVNFDDIASKCIGYSGADLSWLVYLASKNAIDRIQHLPDFKSNGLSAVKHQCIVDADDFSKALEQTKPSVTKKQAQQYERIRQKIETSKLFHEASELNEEPSINS